jgi:FAD/FMN-containing dehydrogenase
LAPLRHALDGAVVAPGDPDYDDARRRWNAGIDRRPAVIAGCTSTADVVAALAFAQERGLDIAVRGGGHNPAGTSINDGGLVVDLSRMNEVTVDPQAKRARVGGGALLGQLDAAAAAHGLATPAGTVSHTGVAGLTLGGGMGWLTRKFGLALDNLESVEIVLADGRVVRCSTEQEPDLFWAVRGAGTNFGVVTEFVFRLHELDPVVHFGFYFFALDERRDVLRRARDLYAGLHPETTVFVVGLNAPPAPFVPPELHFSPGLAVLAVSFAGPELLTELTGRLRAGLAAPLAAMETPMPYVALQQLIDEPNAWGMHAYEKGTYLTSLSDTAIEAIAEHLPRKNSPLSHIILMPLDGGFCATADDATSFGGTRTPKLGAFIIDVAPTAELEQADRPWVRALWDTLQPDAPEEESSYVNGVADYDDARVRAIYGRKYDRLAELKARYDPQNTFHHNANIRPALPAAGTPKPRRSHPDAERSPRR